MIDIHMMAGHGPHEFERAICLVKQHTNVEFASHQLSIAEKRMVEEIQTTIGTIIEKHGNIKKTLYLQLEMALKELHLWPVDYIPARDHLMVKNGVIFHTRHFEQEQNENT